MGYITFIQQSFSDTEGLFVVLIGACLVLYDVYAVLLIFLFESNRSNDLETSFIFYLLLLSPPFGLVLLFHLF
jgi:hypothetical protein